MHGSQTNYPPNEIETELQRVHRETDAIVKKSAKLITETEELIETGRQLREAQAALIEERKKYKKR